MFSKSRINEPGPKAGEPEKGKLPEAAYPRPGSDSPIPAAPKAKPPASMLSSDLVVTGNLKTSGDIQVEGTIDGDIQAHLLTVGESATVRGEVVADDVVINGRVIGRVRGLKVRLTSTARVEGDIIHKTIAIESGAHFEGSVQRQDDPLNSGQRSGTAKPAHVLGESSRTTGTMAEGAAPKT
ncbi:bactofilin family protein [Rhodovulum steppense]|uniref:Cytoskeletal protein CcmA (Bactofilin family) n=1 Tax=Rhodovulum steppense TaxID=540251 RepID=A0A4R1YT23_9RHOB|nr:polymer-forming cytoskeletal protein [Rhodovulum steppense]TCM83398.1 cytoskeletal protein CcmA (bactofilin family) [Rhodovulum steppense]